jgi:peptide/nickel transport system ATP-binding protein
MDSKPLLEIQNLKVSFNDQHKQKNVVLEDINLSIARGETVALIGESGSGKSITSMSILRLLPSSSNLEEGSITFSNQNLLDLSEKEMKKMRGKEISMIFQDAMASLNPAMKIGIQITEGLKYHQLINKTNIKNEALRLLQSVGLKNSLQIYNQYPNQLSGGMKQRVLIAMALSCSPKLIIADEPTTALDVTIQKQVLDLLDQYKHNQNSSILLITHDFGVVAEYADRVYVMFGGRIVESGDVFTIFRNPLHPYTKGLIGSIPTISETEYRLKSIQDYIFEDIGFKDRKFAPEFFSLKDKVYHSSSELVEVEPNHFVRFFTEEEAVISS